jgi:polyphosphate kinase
MVNERGTAFPPGLSRTGIEGERPAWGPERRRGPLWPLPRLDGSVDSPDADAASGEQARAPSLGDPGRFINRELSWLEFGDRLLDLVADDRFPLLERVKFLAIFAEGLDEFFQVRVAGLEDQVAAGLRAQSPDGMSPHDQLHAITARATELVRRHSHSFLHDVGPALTAAGVQLSDWHTLDEPDRGHLADLFHQQIFPILTPLAVGQGHPFPYISNLSLNLVVRVSSPVTGEERMARVKVPSLLPRLVPLPDGRRFVLVEQVVAAHLESIFPSMCIEEHQVFRVTRNVDLSVDEDDTEDRLAALELELHRRRFGQTVRLEISGGISSDLLEMLMAEVDVPEGSVYLSDAPIDLSGLGDLMELDRPDLSAEPWTPVTPASFAGGVDLFAVLGQRDVLVQHPYESFSGSVEAFVAAAAADPDVLAIKQTLYRTGADSPVVASLIRASLAGKQVTAVVELQARFDEQANIAWARALEEAGVQVIYGLVALKTHAKICLVVRREGDQVRRYCHLGTGNYNASTARAYEDLGLFTSDPEIGAEVGELFNLLSGSGEPPTFRRLMVSPLTTRGGLLEAIERESRAGIDGRIVLKTNGLTDPEVIDALYRASQAGVSVDLVVRGRCCLRPGVPGLSEGIRVRSIVGRYLEHSRVFCFGGLAGRPVRVWLGSADLMERNLDRRVEVVVPITDPGLQRRLAGLLDWALLDQANSWELCSDGRWVRVAADLPPQGLGLSLHDQFQSQALASWRSRRDGSRTVPRARRRVPAPVPEVLAARVPIGSTPGAAWVPGSAAPSPSAARQAPWWQRWAPRRR